MADVYKFKVKLKYPENVMWRDIEITSASSVAKLAYSVIASFCGDGSHLFNIKFNGVRYEISYDDPFILPIDDMILPPGMENRSPKRMATEDPIKTKLRDLELSAEDMLDMEYDYGAGWEFSIELLDITEMKKGAGGRYPRILDGAGLGIIENGFPGQLEEFIKMTDEGDIPKINDPYDKEIEWDYRKFNVKWSNLFFKDYVRSLKECYENA